MYRAWTQGDDSSAELLVDKGTRSTRADGGIRKDGFVQSIGFISENEVFDAC